MTRNAVKTVFYSQISIKFSINIIVNVRNLWTIKSTKLKHPDQDGSGNCFTKPGLAKKLFAISATRVFYCSDIDEYTKFHQIRVKSQFLEHKIAFGLF